MGKCVLFQMVMVRRAMTEVLLKVTNTEIMKICQEEIYRNRYSNNAGTLNHSDLKLNVAARLTRLISISIGIHHPTHHLYRLYSFIYTYINNQLLQTIRQSISISINDLSLIIVVNHSYLLLVTYHVIYYLLFTLLLVLL